MKLKGNLTGGETVADWKHNREVTIVYNSNGAEQALQQDGLHKMCWTQISPAADRNRREEASRCTSECGSKQPQTTCEDEDRWMDMSRNESGTDCRESTTHGNVSATGSWNWWIAVRLATTSCDLEQNPWQADDSDPVDANSTRGTGWWLMGSRCRLRSKGEGRHGHLAAIEDGDTGKKKIGHKT
jgi:hypothetical protein